MDINNNKTRAEQLFEFNKEKRTRSEELIRKQASISKIPEITNRMVKGVSDERRELMEHQLEAGEFREQGSGFRTSRSNDQPLKMVQTQAGVVSHSGRGLYKMSSSTGNSLSSSSGWRGSNDSVRQAPEVYSPLWLNSNLNLPRERSAINAWSRSFFALNPIVNNAISLHSTYPIAKLNIKAKDPKIEKFFSEMIEEIDLMNLCVLAAQEFWILGEAFIYSELDESKGKWSRLMILNPDFVNVQRNVISAEPIISLRPDENLRRVVFGNQPSDITQRQQLDPSIIEHVRRNENIPLNNFYVHHMARRISPYEIRGTGLIVSCFRALMLWDKLRESKYAQADNMVNPLTLVKIGSPEFKPTPVDLEHWRNVFEECHDEETEVLTNKGFIKFDKAIEINNALEENSSKFISTPKQGIKIACFNPETEQLEYHIPSESHVYNYNGEMYHFHNDKMDIKVTPNHKMWVQKKNIETSDWTEWNKIRVKDMEFSDCRFRSKAKWEGNDSINIVNVSDNNIEIEKYLEYLGYFISEGYSHTNNEKINNIIEFSGKDNRIISIIDYFTKQICNRIPSWVLGLSSRLLDILLKALIIGENGKQSGFDQFYNTTSKHLANDIYEAVYKAGYIPTMFEKQGIFIIQWSINNIDEFSLVNEYSINPDTKEKTEIVSKVNYQGKVWCFTVPTGLFITRRNGKITIQGNSQYDKDFKIFTHDAVAVERVGYAQGIYDTSNDVQQLIKEIYIGLMVPSVIMDGSDTTYATGSVALDVLRQRYMQFRQMMTSWLKRKLFAPISQINDFYDYVDGEKTLQVPDVDWNHMSLFDMDSYINNLVNLSQGEGVQKRVSLQTLYRSIGLEYEEEQRKIRYESIQDAIRMRELASMARYPIHELKALGPGDDIEEIDEPVPGQSPYEQVPGQGAPEGGSPGGLGGGGSPGGGLSLPGAPPPSPIGGGGLKPPSPPS